MKKIILILLSVLIASAMPFTWQVSGHYKLTERFSAGIGTGLSFYEKALIPVFADIRYQLAAAQRWVPYLQCSMGYSFAPEKDVNGGYFFNSTIGIQYAIHDKTKLLLGIGYEIQNLERLKKHESNEYATEFQEKLHHNSISIKLGILF